VTEERKLSDIIEFVSSLGLIGYIVLFVIVLCLFNLKKLIFLKSPLDSQQHKLWRRVGAETNPDHLEKIKKQK